MEEEEQLLNLFDIYWFYHKSLQIPPSSPPPIDPAPLKPETQIDKKPPISRLRSLHRRSLSDQLSSKTDPFSPNSVLPAVPKLETILSGKEAGGEPILQEDEVIVERPPKKAIGRRKKKGSRSLSELEFEELKGFIDLGFNFSEVEIDSRLVSIVPGVKRLGKGGGGEEGELGKSAVSRPYLSEAWSFERKELDDPIVNWRISAAGDEIAMKDQLKCWAHAVASTVI